MRRSFAPAAFCLAVTTATAALAAPPPDAVRVMLQKALESGDPAVLAAVAGIAKEANPDSAAEIDAIARGETPPVVIPRVAFPAKAQVAPAPPSLEPAPGLLTAALVQLPKFGQIAPARWSGTAELGGSRSTGSSDVLGAYGSLDVALKGPVWTHRFTARAEYQRTDGVTSTERYGVAYEPRVQVRPSLYAYGLGQYEHDRFLGYGQRYTVGAGVGMKMVDRPDLTVGGDLGPALRRTDYYEFGEEDALAGRASLSIKWLPTGRVTLSQDAAVYAYGDQTSAKSTTALETLLFGPLKARLSYNLQYEHDPRLYRNDLDTVTRASLLYSF